MKNKWDAKEEVYTPKHVYKFTGPCIVTGKPYTVSVPAPGLYKYHQGAFIQVAFPNMPAGDREFLISGCILRAGPKQ